MWFPPPHQIPEANTETILSQIKFEKESQDNPPYMTQTKNPYIFYKKRKKL